VRTQILYRSLVRNETKLNETLTKKEKKRKTGKINMNGRAKILTQDDVMEGVREWQNSQDKAIEGAAVKKKVKEHYSAAVDVWKVREMDRKDRNGKLKSGWEADVKKWTVERDDAKNDCRKPRWTKPKMPMLEKALQKPLLIDFVMQEDSEGGEEEEEEGLEGGDGASDGGDSSDRDPSPDLGITA